LTRLTDSENFEILIPFFLSVCKLLKNIDKKAF